MQMVKRIFFGSFLFLLFLIVLAPKQELYYKLEHELKKNDIIISDEKFKANPFGFTITDANIYFKGLKVANFKSLDLKIFYLYDRLEAKNIKVDKSIRDIGRGAIPIESIDNLVIKFSILKPYKISLEANGSFGDASGGLYFNPNRIFIRIINPKNITKFRQFLKEDAKGLYYEKPLE